MPVDLDRIEARANRATPGPWFPYWEDDDSCMNSHGVATTDGIDSPEDSYADIICATLYQSKRIACHRSRKWEEDAEFIANAREDIPALIAELRAARAVVELAREWVTDGVPLSDNWSDRTIAAVMAYDALTQPERGEAG